MELNQKILLNGLNQNMMRKRHEEEIRIAKEQHEIRMQAMRERHFSELIQVANPSNKQKDDAL